MALPAARNFRWICLINPPLEVFQGVIDCILNYQFPSCQHVGIFDCHLESHPVTSQERQDQIMKNITTTNGSSDINSTQTHDNSTILESAAEATSCAAYCRDLGFIENPDDANANDYDSLCTRHELHNWTSCACGVVISLDSGRSVSIVDGMYVCIANRNRWRWRRRDFRFAMHSA